MFDFSCKNHDKFIPLRGGKLYGLPGSEHLARITKLDLNVFLSDLMFPEETPFCSGLPGPPTNLKIICFSLRDQHAPDDNQTLEWLLLTIEAALEKGESVAVSCQGGHGRTGTILALLWGRANPGADPVKAVRELGCPSMVESWRQTEFIFDYFKMPNPYEKPPVVISQQSRFASSVPHRNADDDWVKCWTDPAWRLAESRKDGKDHLTLDFAPEQIFVLANGEDVAETEEGQDIPVVCVYDGEVLVGAVIRYMCHICCADIAFDEESNLFICLGQGCGLERPPALDWKKFPVEAPKQ